MKNVTENNKLIAEFMGIENSGEYYFIMDEHLMEITDATNGNVDSMGYMFKPSDMKYHSSWDWLMPVVRKIVELCCNDEDDKWFLADHYTSILETVPLAIIEDAYKVVVEFITWYNENK